jgi:AcrR family transcriptional regulator
LTASDPRKPPARPDLERLPPGRHGLEREAVVANQRTRLLAATALAVVEVGYGALTVSDLTTRAGVSRVTFYQLFGGKSEMLVAAFDEAFAELRAAITAACSAHPSWPHNVIAAVGAVLSFAADAPAQAALLTVPSIGIEAALSHRAAAANRELAGLLRSASGPGAAGGLPAVTEEALVAGAGSAIASRLAAGRDPDLAAIGPQLAELILIPYLGSAEAAALISGLGPQAV